MASKRSLLRLFNENILHGNVWKRNTYRAVARPDFTKMKDPKLSSEDKFTMAAKIDQKIKVSGPITVADYMREILANPVGGYYMNKDVFGLGGDFTTSPEISQLFGEIVGAWIFTEWIKLGSPKPLQIVELGPGRGTLMTDMLRVVNTLSIEKSDLSIHLVEISPILRNIQASQLCYSHRFAENQPHYYEGETASGIKVYWYKDLNEIPKNFSLYVAHEFFDALPIHKFKKTPEGWREILIDIDDKRDPETKISKYRYVLSRAETVASKLYVPLCSPDDSMEQLEICPQSLSIAKELAERIEENGGIALITDYGENHNKGDTFRAFKNHKQVNPLEDVGSADLTADVHFDLLKRAAGYAKVLGPISQKKFLECCQAETRLKILLENAPPDLQDNLKSGYKMLTDADGMGTLFKFMAIFPTIDEEFYKKSPIIAFMLEAPNN